MSAVERNIGIEYAECAKEVSRMLGFRSLSADLRNCISAIASEMVVERSLILSGDQLRLPEVR